MRGIGFGKVEIVVLACGATLVASGALAAPPTKIVAARATGPTEVRAITLGSDGLPITSADYEPYPGFAGGSSMAAADGPTGTWIATGAGPSGGPHVRIVHLAPDGGLTDAASFFAFGESFHRGLSVATYVVGSDQFVVVGKGPGGRPRVRIFKIDEANNVSRVASFFAYDPAFRGGVSVAAGDVNGDGVVDIITGAGSGGVPEVRVFDGASPDLSNPSLLGSFLAYSPMFTGGVFVAAGDLDGDGRAEIVTGAGPGGGPHVRVFRGSSPNLSSPDVLTEFFAFGTAFTGGVQPSTAQLDGSVDLVTAAGPGGKPKVKVFHVSADGSMSKLAAFPAFEPSYRGGVSVGGLGRVVIGSLADHNGDGAIDFVFFGDSITEGFGDNDGEPPEPGPGYPSRLVDQFPGVAILNEGLGGEQTDRGMFRLLGVIQQDHPDYVLLLEGINDFSHAHEQQVVPNLTSMVDSVLQAGALPLLATITPTCCNYDFIDPQQLGETNRELAVLAADRGIPLVDFHAIFTNDPDGSANPNSGLIHVPDGLHPNRNGYDAMADVAADAMRALSP